MSSTDPLQRFSLRGQTAVVTGASSGLGQHIAGVLARAGASVVCCARRADRLKEVVAQLAAEGGSASLQVMDVCDRASICTALDAARPFDILVNNAGVTLTKRLLEFDDDDWNSITGTNLTGAWTVAQEAARRMVAQHVAGSIINITSILGVRVAGGVSPYIAAKAGLRSLTQAMALELARHDIRVNSLAPGYFMTELNSDFLHSQSGEKLRQRIPFRRFGHPSDLDGALLLLASPAGSFITGSEIVVDGGHLCSGL
jgi:NAD(P)-dependent dehydrogenase (short-subunit alcohol dehydrogenase family)